MNHCAIQEKVAFAAREEMRSSFAAAAAVPASERRDPLVCPKPRRFGHFNSAFNDHIRPSPRWHFSYQAEISDSRAGNELLDIILSKGGGYGMEQTNTAQVASPPPFFSGSPPTRVANPLIQDAKFREEKITPVSTLQQFSSGPNSGRSSSPSTMSSGRKGGCVRVSFGNNPAVRVEGFDCLDRNRSVPAFA